MKLHTLVERANSIGSKRPVHIVHMAVRQWLRAHRTQINSTKAWFQSRLEDFAIGAGWALLTWSAFQWNKRAWAASVGLYLFFGVAIEAYANHIAAKREQLRAHRDR